MNRRTLCVVALVTLAGASAHAHAGTTPEPPLALIVDTVAQTYVFEGTLTTDPGPFGSGFRARWELNPPGTQLPGNESQNVGLGSRIAIGQSNPGALLGAWNLQFFANGAGDDLMRIDAGWAVGGDPGTITLTGIGIPQTYANLQPTTIAMLERSVGSVLGGANPTTNAPGIPIIGIPAPGALTLFACMGLARTPRRRA